MLIEDEKNLLDKLTGGNTIKIAFDGSDIMIRFLDDASKVFLTTSVYSGGNYIPSSVRRCLSHKFPLSHTSIQTYLTVDEPRFLIHLNYLGQAQHLNDYLLRNLLEEFVWIAEKWRSFLDEHDKNDLVYVRVK